MVILTFKIFNFLAIYFCLTNNLFKTFQECQHYNDTNFQWSMPSKVSQGHIRSLLNQNYFSKFVYGPILIKNCMNANIKKTKCFNKSYFLCYGEVSWFFTLRPSDLIIILAYILMDNYFPCLFMYSIKSVCKSHESF